MARKSCGEKYIGRTAALSGLKRTVYIPNANFGCVTNFQNVPFKDQRFKRNVPWICKKIT